jgi:hypothetical protein
VSSFRREGAPQDWTALVDSGLLWLINRSVFHPRGYALAVSEDGWDLLGDGTDPWHFELPEGMEDELFQKVKELLP